MAVWWSGATSITWFVAPPHVVARTHSNPPTTILRGTSGSPAVGRVVPKARTGYPLVDAALRQLLQSGLTCTTACAW